MFKKIAVVLLAATLVSNCGISRSLRTGQTDVIGGPTGDVRVILEPDCAAAKRASNRNLNNAQSALGFAGFGENVLVNVGGMAFRSFGQYLEESNKERTTRAYGLNGGLFYTVPNEDGEVDIDLRMRCIYIVRNGFGPGPARFDRTPPAALQPVWRKLNLTRTPDLFAALHIETAGETGVSKVLQDASAEFDASAGGINMPARGDESGAPIRDNRANGLSESFIREMQELEEEEEEVEESWETPEGLLYRAINPPFFRIVLDDLYVGGFQDTNSSQSKRDTAFVFNFARARSEATVNATLSTPGVTALTQTFAKGAIRIPGLEKGYYSPKGVTGLQTAWMRMPGIRRERDNRGTTDIGVYVVEYDPGNKMLQDIGSYLSQEDTVKAFTDALAQEVDLDGSNEQQEIRDRFQKIGTENRLLGEVQEARIDLLEALENESDSPPSSDTRSKARTLEEKVLAVEQEEQLNGWIQKEKLSEKESGRSLLRDLRLQF